MQNSLKTLLAYGIIATAALTGCSTDDAGTNPIVTDKAGVLTGGTGAQAQRILSKDTVYSLQGFYFIQPGTKLVIPAGTRIECESGSAIVTLPGTSTKASGQLVAQGTAAEPIVFTSSRPEGSRSRADWGGIVLSGLSDLNLPTHIGIQEGVPGSYGYGTAGLSTPKLDDTSGILTYVRIEYGGMKVTADNEINGLTFNAVGSGTTIDHVQSHMIADDGFEWFGGTVNAKYLVSSGNDDDAFDMDFGYSGRLQFLFAIQDPDLANRGFEIDNDAQGSSNAPFTSATVSNVTLVGTGKEKAPASDDDNDGFYLRRNNKLKIYNAVVTNFRYGLVIDGGATKTNADNGELFVKNSVLNGILGMYLFKGGTAADLDPIVAKNNWDVNNSAVNLTSIAFESPNPVPTSTTGFPQAAQLNDASGFFTPVNYIGAFGTDNWLTGWTNFKKK